MKLKEWHFGRIGQQATHSAPEAAHAPAPVAPRVAATVPEVKEAEGYKLFLASNNDTGYLNVFKHPNGKFQATYWDSELVKQAHLGPYDTAVEAAVAYAKKHMAAKGVHAVENDLSRHRSLRQR